MSIWLSIWDTVSSATPTRIRTEVPPKLIFISVKLLITIGSTATTLRKSAPIRVMRLIILLR